MWFNGFLVAIDRALARAASPLLSRQRDAIVLGCLREDVWYVPVVGAVVQNPSLDHFCRAGVHGGFVPWLTQDAGARTQRLAQKAVRAMREGRIARAMVDLGRAAHPVIDMACPVHAQGVAHGDDAYEWCVEAMAPHLRELPDAPRVACDDFAGAARSMARHAQALPVARESSVARAQAELLMPLAAAHVCALFERFLAAAGDPRDAAGDPIDEALAAIGMPRPAIGAWLGQLEDFASRHGGVRYYAQLLDLVAAARSRIDAGPRLAPADE